MAVLSHALAYVRDHNRLTFTSVSVSEMLLGLYVKEATQQIKKATAFLKSHEELVPSSEDYWLAAEINAGDHVKRDAGKTGGVDHVEGRKDIAGDLAIAIDGNRRRLAFFRPEFFGSRPDNRHDCGAQPIQEMPSLCAGLGRNEQDKEKDRDEASSQPLHDSQNRSWAAATRP